MYFKIEGQSNDDFVMLFCQKAKNFIPKFLNYQFILYIQKEC